MYTRDSIYGNKNIIITHKCSMSILSSVNKTHELSSSEEEDHDAAIAKCLFSIEDGNGK